MKLYLTNQRVRELIPNVIHEVKGETTLLDKLQPWLDSAKMWLRDIALADEEIPHVLTPLVERIVVSRAFASAAPSLDLSLSPNGFSVINTDGRAPASKERVERLIASLNDTAERSLAQLVERLGKVTSWRSSEIGQWWLATFIPDLREVPRFREHAGLMTTYRTMRSIALRFEQGVEEFYLGSLIDKLRKQQGTQKDTEPLVGMIRQAELRYIAAHIHDKETTCPKEHELWHLMRPIMNRLEHFPECYAEWMEGMGSRFTTEPFKNNVKGGYYF